MILEAFWYVSLSRERGYDPSSLETFVRQEQAIADCYFVFGDNDYVMKINTRNSVEYQRLKYRMYQSVPAVSAINDQVVVATIKRSTKPTPG
ncbi:Lrp/AsnC ligand binding domain-containing protein [Saccharospirillum sp. HFRX-1]|uniref:Lrp/AsnC ligand binding domain-containing protein n=1 Tax=unclassified Saccharospirillum TaxID=2633430 RepID=UPI00371EA59B